jgi:hypothetical protein
MSLSTNSIDWAISHLEKVGDSDLFPRPVELDAVLALKDDVKSRLTSLDLSKCLPSPARRFIVPKYDLSVRQATQLNLLDSIILTSIIHECGSLIEQRRRATSENRVFSYRFKPDNDGWLYDRNFDWTPFWANCYDNSKQYSHALVLDISDFYNQIYHHTIENQLIQSGLPNQYTQWIKKLLESLTAKVSRGIPVGPHATHLLAEATLIPVDNSLVSQGVNFCRFVDDFVIFANSEDEARAYLYRFSDTLDKQQRLILNKQKTRLLSSSELQSYCKKMIEDRPINHLERQLLGIVKKYSGGNPYQIVRLSQITEDDLKSFSKRALELILNEYLLKENNPVEKILMLFKSFAYRLLSPSPMPDSSKSVNFIRLRWFLRRLTQIGHPGAIDFCLKNLNHLIPSLADVCHYLSAASVNYEGDCVELGERLLKALSNEVVSSNEYFQLCVLSLFARNSSFNHFSQLVRLFDNSSGVVRREIIISARNNNGADWLRELKETYPSMDIWCKQAFLVSAKGLVIEERKFFAQSITANSILDEILLKWLKMP